jgi:hypothetical protein
LSTQYFRNVSLIVAPANGSLALELNEFHFNFWVRRGDNQTPNSLTVRIYNLSRETAQQLSNAPTSEFSRVVLQCGYIGLPGEQPFLGTIFDGNIKYVNTGNETAKDSFIEIVAADGDSAYNFAFVNITLAAGSTHTDQINACLAAMSQVRPDGITGGYIPTYTTPLPYGKTMFGLARDYLRDISKTVQASWSIQDGQLQLVPLDGYLPNEAIDLNSATGLIGFPQRTLSGLQVRCLINPQIKIGGRIRINNAYVQGLTYSLTTGGNAGIFPSSIAIDADGYYRVLWVEHTGDTRGNQWYSDLICISLDASVAFPEAAARSVVPGDEVVKLPQSASKS